MGFVNGIIMGVFYESSFNAVVGEYSAQVGLGENSGRGIGENECELYVGGILLQSRGRREQLAKEVGSRGHSGGIPHHPQHQFLQSNFS